LYGDTLVDSALVVAARDGDRAAMDDLVSAYLPLVYNVVGRALRGHADVDDVVQETMLRVVHGLPGLRDPQRFRSWLVTIAMRQIQERGRARRAAPSPAAPVDPVNDVADLASDFADLTVERLHLSGQRREVAEATRWLGGEDRHLLSLWWLEAAGELSRADLAAALKLSAPHANVRVQRMKAQLETARSVVRALSATPRCPDLAHTAQRWDGRPDTLWLKRFGRHIRHCADCGRYGSAMVPADRLLAGLALVPVPVAMAAKTTVAGAAAGPLARLVHLLLAKPLVTATVGAAVIAGGTGIGYLETVHRAPPVTALAPAVASPVSSPTPAPTRAVATAPVTGGVTRADFYVSPRGDDAASGSAAHPFATLAKAVSVVRAGQTVALRGGVYRPTAQVRIAVDGTAAKRITVTNYGTEHPVLDGSALPEGDPLIHLAAGYWTVQGLEVRDVRGRALVCLSCRYDTFQRLSVHDNLDTGLDLLQDNTIGNQIVDSDFYRNHDDATKGRNADGIGIKFGSGAGNTVRNCRVYENADDGLDLWSFAGAVTVTGTWAWGNGVNRWGVPDWKGDGAGFRLGGDGVSAAHVLTDDAAWDNAGNGFTGVDNGGGLLLANDTAVRNGDTAFQFKNARATLRGNLTDGAAFVSTDPGTAQGPRRPAGRRPGSPIK
jgi:RNA polymerase sigma factor (sigma-70 family)